MTFQGGQWNSQRHGPDQFRTRVTVLGGLAIVVLSVIFFRLWYLQVLSGDEYLAEAQGNRVREVTVQAPRGEILDRDGEVLVGNRTALALQIHPDELPALHERKVEVLQRVAKAADMSLEKVQNEIRKQTEELPSNPVTLRRDVPQELVFYLRENADEFPGVTVDQVYVRRYPLGTTGAHLFGYVREVSAEDLSDPRYDDLLPGDEIGKDGIELSYDSLLRGINGVTRIPVDASGEPTGRAATVRTPQTGDDLVLSIDSGLQQAGESALSQFGLPGGFVAMDVRNGEILAMGSNPTFDPSLFAKPVIPENEYEAISSEENGSPLLNRAIQGAYPTGSTFKPITALAALDADVLETDEIINDDGAYDLGDGNVLQNAGGVSHGPVDLRDSLKVSSDIYYYTLGGRLEEVIDKREYIQDWSADLGLGAESGLDIPNERPGLIPTPEWRNELYEDELTDRPWSLGDSVNLSIGQGDLQANPLQMAVAYAAIGNGGQIVTPHLGIRAEDPAGRVVQEMEPPPRREVDIPADARDAIMDGITAAAMEPGGTSYEVFGGSGFPVDVAGKTGTAETFHEGVPYDQSWYVALAPARNPRIVVALTVERGGFGADSAAPAVRSILTEYFKIGAEDLDETVDPGAGAATVGYD